MLRLFPPLRSNASYSLAVDDHHTLYIEESGHSDGIPVVFLHGGPGAGCDSSHRRFFDPQRYRIILFDQRGCGKSRPHASLKDNTTADLVADLEKIRELLKIDQWLVFGGSWGSTLALCYAQSHPQRVLGLVLRGVFLCRDKDIAWFYEGGTGHLFPKEWQDFQKPVAPERRNDIIQAYYELLTSDNELVRMGAAKAWSVWEGKTLTLKPQKPVINQFSDPFRALSLARIECHYFVNNSFLEDNQILNNIDKIAEIPLVIVHGRYDVICPVTQAWELHKAWPGSELKIIDDAGHASSEPGIVNALVEATESFAERLS